MGNDRDYDYRYGQRRDTQGYGSGRDYGYSGGRDQGFGGREDRNFRGGGTGYGDGDGYRSGGRDEWRPDNYGGRETYGAGSRDYYGGSQHNDRGYGDQQRGGQFQRGAYGSDGNRWSQGDRGRGGDRGYGRAPQGYDYQDRGFVARAGDEVRSWFGDEEAERRREFDQRYDERFGGASGTAYGRDSDYSNWRRGQIDALDRDYNEYRQENAKKFESEFGSWRTNRQTQRASLGQVKEHMDVVGNDGAHVGTVDKVRGDRIILTKNDSDAGGRHHSIPSSWLMTVDDKVTISKSADEAKRHWRDEEESGALFGSNERGGAGDRDVNLNRSFSGTY